MEEHTKAYAMYPRFIHAYTRAVGILTRYYGMDESQNRGTLQIHLLLWLAGNPSLE